MSNPATSLRTVPATLDQPPAYLPTGNEWLALPTVRPDDGAVESVNLVHMGARGLVSFAGAPLLQPEVRAEGAPLSLNAELRWERLGHWMPRWQWLGEGVLLSGTLVSPPEHRGVLYLLTARNTGTEPRRLYLGLRGRWDQIVLHIFRGRLLPATRSVFYDEWTDALVLEAIAGMPLAALALASDGPLEWRANEGLGPGPISYAVGRTVELGPGEELTVPIFVAAGVERDGASTTAMDLRRRGWRQLFDEARNWLAAQLGDLLGDQPFDAPAPAAFDPYLNLIFNRLYAYGRTIDTEELICCTSRSPLYYVSAAFWARDTYLLSFPALLLHDRVFAREVLLTSLARYGANGAHHALTIAGTRLYPGFELDQYCAPALALYRYVNVTGDLQILDEPVVGSLLNSFVKGSRPWQDTRLALFRTFLRSTDDPAGDLPYITYSNALMACALRALASLQARTADSARSGLLQHMAALVAEAVGQHCQEGAGEHLHFTGAVDLHGRRELFDEPPGSLLLLPFYGFCPADDPRYLETVRWILSADNPAYIDGPFGGPGCDPDGQPWPLALANVALAGLRLADDSDPLERLAGAPLDGGLACESMDAQSGAVATGRHFATAAGWLAFAWFNAQARHERVDHAGQHGV